MVAEGVSTATDEYFPHQHEDDVTPDSLLQGLQIPHLLNGSNRGPVIITPSEY
jgi:hypothetical protein